MDIEYMENSKIYPIKEQYFEEENIQDKRY